MTVIRAVISEVLFSEHELRKTSNDFTQSFVSQSRYFIKQKCFSSMASIPKRFFQQILTIQSVHWQDYVRKLSGETCEDFYLRAGVQKSRVPRRPGDWIFYSGALCVGPQYRNWFTSLLRRLEQWGGSWSYCSGSCLGGLKKTTKCSVRIVNIPARFKPGSSTIQVGSFIIF
jgi:hypothetical protein